MRFLFIALTLIAMAGIAGTRAEADEEYDRYIAEEARNPEIVKEAGHTALRCAGRDALIIATRFSGRDLDYPSTPEEIENERSRMIYCKQARDILRVASELAEERLQTREGALDAAGGRIDAPAATIAGIGCTDLSGAWKQTSGNSGSSTWTITGPPGGPYRAKEDGLGEADGPATYSAGKLKIVWTTKDRKWSGYYEWPLGPGCTGGRGDLVFTKGARKDEKDTSTVTRVR